MFELSTIIPVYNCWELTEACLRSLAEHSAGHTQEVIVVDNASTDATAQACPALGKTLFGAHFQYLRQEKNRNFGPACNIGARAARSDIIFFLNNDTLLTAGWLPPLLQAVRDADAPVLAGPLLLYPQFLGFPDRVQHMGVTVTPHGCVEHLFEGFPADHPACRAQRPLQIITGAALMLNRQFFLENGAFHEGFINGFEDVELCRRLGKRGAQMCCVPDSRVYHLVSRTAGRHKYKEHNSRLLRRLCTLIPDWEYFAKRQGYEIAMAPGAELYPRLPERRRQLLEKQHARHPDSLRELLLQEPLWYEGYSLLADQLAAAGDVVRAMQTLSLAYNFYPHPTLLDVMLRLAVQSEDSILLEDAKTSWEKAHAVTLDILISHALGWRSYFLQHHNGTLVTLYDQWLRQAVDLLPLYPATTTSRQELAALAATPAEKIRYVLSK